MKFIKHINIFRVSSRASSCLSCLLDNRFLKRLHRLQIWYNLAQENRNMFFATESRTEFSTFVCREMLHPIMLSNLFRNHQALFSSTIATRTRRHTELTNLMGELCCAREHSVQFFHAVFLTVKLHALTQSLWGSICFIFAQ